MKQASGLRLYLGLIVGVALAIRVGAVLYLGDFGPPWDEDWEVIARTLVEKGYFGLDPNSLYGPNPRLITAFIPPVYPVFLALMRALAGPWAWLATRLAQAGLSTLAVALAYRLGWKVFRRADVSLLGAGLAAVYPPLIGGVAETNAVTLEVLFVEFFTLLVLTAMEQPVRGMWRWAAAGVVLGVAALTRATVLVLLPLLVPCFWLNRPGSFFRAALLPVITIGVAAAAVISPWTWRNWITMHEFIPISSNGGVNFWIGNNPQATGEFTTPTQLAPELVAGSAHLGEGARDRFFYRQGLTFIRENPGEFFRLLGAKLVYFLWSRPGIGGAYANQSSIGLGRAAYQVSNAVMLPLWLLGMALSARDDFPSKTRGNSPTHGTSRRLSVFYVAILGVLLVNLMYFAGTRYRTPAAPYQLLFASYGLTAAGGWVYRRVAHTRNAASGDADSA